ncbi:MAG: GNAT family N-acetyltransferase [Flavobacteriaceae bacterium]|nr:GNAT family N-acetyltransferase [Flavobacteriaceae bacterium]
MILITKTNRLYLRELTLEDALHFFEMNTDNAVIKYTGDVPFASIAAAKEFLKAYQCNYVNYKMGRWAVCLKTTNAMIGWCGLKYHPKENFADIGYRFYKKHWNKGYATEATKAALAYGFSVLKLDCIVAHVHKDNIGSQKVALKSGLHFVKDFIHEDEPAKCYVITKRNYNVT